MANEFASSTGWFLYKGEPLGVVRPWSLVLYIWERKKGERRENKTTERVDKKEKRGQKISDWLMTTILETAKAGPFTEVNL